MHLSEIKVPPLSDALRERFEYQRQSFANPFDAAATIAWLRQRGIDSSYYRVEGRHCVWVPMIEGYFLPEGRSAEDWEHAV